MIRRVSVMLALTVCVASAAAACPVCVGDTDSQMAQGTNNAILFLLAIVSIVQVGIVALILSFRRRSRGLETRRQQFVLVERGTR